MRNKPRGAIASADVGISCSPPVALIRACPDVDSPHCWWHFCVKVRCVEVLILPDHREFHTTSYRKPVNKGRKDSKALTDQIGCLRVNNAEVDVWLSNDNRNC